MFGLSRNDSLFRRLASTIFGENCEKDEKNADDNKLDTSIGDHCFAITSDQQRKR
jgi:hypothetical protein